MSSRVRTNKKEKKEEQKVEPLITQTAQTPVVPPTEPVVEQTITRGEGLRILLNNPENGPVVRKLIYTTILMFTLPFIAFFAFRNLDYAGMPLLHMYFKDRDIVGAIGALAAIQVLIAGYIYVGLTEPDEREEAFTNKQKQD